MRLEPRIASALLATKIGVRRGFTKEMISMLNRELRETLEEVGGVLVLEDAGKLSATVDFIGRLIEGRTEG